MSVFARFFKNRDGNFGMMFGLLVMPICLSVGVSIDYVRAHNVRVRMQSDLDAALLSAVKRVDNLDEGAIRARVTKWFAAQTELEKTKYSLTDATITVSKADKTIRAVVRGNLATTFMGLANIRSMNVAVVSAVAGPESSYLNVYIVLDKSASMMLAATKSGQDAMRKATGNCVFACHEAEGDPIKYDGNSYSTNYAVAKGLNVQLRADVSVDAAKQVLNLVQAADPAQQHIRVGLYSIGSKATEVLAPTFSIGSVRTALVNDLNGLTSATSEPASYFNNSLPAMADLVGPAGDGVVQSDPRKLVLMLTDGVQSDRPWVMSNDKGKTTPLNPAWCKDLKENDAAVGVLYTEYLPMTFDGGYQRTVGDTMKSSLFASLWGGVMREGVKGKTTRRDYIPMALEDCASEKALFLSASEPEDIEKGLSNLFEQYLTNVRLTQ